MTSLECRAAVLVDAIKGLPEASDDSITCSQSHHKLANADSSCTQQPLSLGGLLSQGCFSNSYPSMMCISWGRWRGVLDSMMLFKCPDSHSL